MGYYTNNSGGGSKNRDPKITQFEKTYAIYYGGKHYNFGVSYLLVTQEVGKRHEAQRLEKGGKQNLWKNEWLDVQMHQ